MMGQYDVVYVSESKSSSSPSHRFLAQNVNRAEAERVAVRYSRECGHADFEAVRVVRHGTLSQTLRALTEHKTQATG